MSKELAPRLEKLESTEALIPSIAVRIPTKDVMPIAIMQAVRMVLRRFALMLRIPSLMFSMKIPVRITALKY
jgi:hypothetical protein